jgi:6-phosphogluconolactonase
MNELFFNFLMDAQKFLKNSVEKALNDQIQKYGQAVLILPGGNSIKSFYDVLGQMKVDWSHIWISLCDERIVSADSELRNEKQLREHFLFKLPCDHFLALDHILIEKIQKFPPITVLSMGEDGHVASLFPEEAIYWNEEKPSSFYETKKQTPNRISLSKSILLLSEKIYIVVKDQKRLEKFEELQKSSFCLSDIYKKSVIVKVL